MGLLQYEIQFFQYRQGLLRFLGYRVGASGVGALQRQELLRSVYNGPLPSLNSKEYMEEWGKPTTGGRLRKIAESIAAFVRNAKRRDARRLSIAITEWEADLAYLKSRFYDGHYDFTWPDTNASRRGDQVSSPSSTAVTPNQRLEATRRTASSSFAHCVPARA